MKTIKLNDSEQEVIIWALEKYKKQRLPEEMYEEINIIINRIKGDDK